MNGSGSARLVVALTALMLCVSSGVSAANGLGVRVESGTVLPYGAPDETGNAVGVHLTYDLEAFQFSLGGGFAFPGSRTQEPLVMGQVMTQWHPWRDVSWAQNLSLSPYMSLGVGTLDFAHEEETRETFDDESSVRWVHEGDQFIGLLGLGVSYGVPDALVVSVEARAVNHTHLSFLLGAGTRF